LTYRGRSRNPSHPLPAFRSSPEYGSHPSRLRQSLTSTSSASLAVPSPSTSSRHQAATHPGGNQPPGTCPLSVSHALRALLHPVPAGLVSCRSRPWGSTLQGSSHPRSRTPSRTPLPSCGYLPAGRCAIPPVSEAHQGRASFTCGIFIDAAPWSASPTTGPCSPRASVSTTGGLVRTVGRDPHGLVPP
jgi:hypothetical protein